jgi:hypothetical protein
VCYRLRDDNHGCESSKEVFLPNGYHECRQYQRDDFEVILPEALCAEIRFRRLDPKCAQIYFLGIDGFDIEMGLTTPNVIESRVNLAMVKAATNIVSVCDSAKFITRSLSKIVDVASIHHVITDSNLLKTVAEGIRNFRCQANFGLARLSRRHDSMVIGLGSPPQTGRSATKRICEVRGTVLPVRRSR